MKNPAATLFLLFSVLGATVWSQEPVPVGGEFQVNSYTTNPQYFPSVAVNNDGSFAVVWTSDGSSGSDTSLASIQLRRFASDGTSGSNDFQVNTYTTGDQFDAVVAVDSVGNLAVVWASDGSSGSDTSLDSIQLRRFTSDGTPISDDIQVNTYTTGGQWGPVAAIDSVGNFAVVWTSVGSYDTDTSSSSIQAQRFASNGTPQGTQFQVNTYTTNSQGSPDVVMAGNGNFVVVWNSDGSSGTDSDWASIQGQRFASDGTPQGTQFQVNTYTTSGQFVPDVAISADRDFVVVWSSHTQDGDSWGVFGQLVDSLGTLQGPEFQVNTYTTYLQSYPGVAVAENGDFVVVWESLGSFGTDSSGGSMQGQRFAASATPLGGQFQVNTYTTGDQGYYDVGSDVAIAGNGGFVVTWGSSGSFGTDSSSSSIQGQRFVIPVFADGFESGDTSAWSSSSP